MHILTSQGVKSHANNHLDIVRYLLNYSELAEYAWHYIINNIISLFTKRDLEEKLKIK